MFSARSKNPKTGFTLVEFLVGLGIFSIIALSLYTVFSNGILLYQSSQKNGIIYNDIRWTFETLSRDLENIVPFTTPYDTDDTNQEGRTFEGTADQLTFVIPSPTGLKAVTYSLQQPEKTHIYKTLVASSTTKNIPINVKLITNNSFHYFVRDELPLEQSPFLVEPSPSERKEEESPGQEILSTHVQPDSLVFSYAQRSDTTGELTWEKEWKPVYLPVGVRIEMAFKNPEAPDNPITVQRNIYLPIGDWGRAE